jgi:rubredoxin
MSFLRRRALALLAMALVWSTGAGAAAGGLRMCRNSDCRWVYDQAVGDADHAIPPGVAFADLPEDWVCPNCGSPKAAFRPYTA